MTELIGIEYNNDRELYILTYCGSVYTRKTAEEVQDFRDLVFWDDEDDEEIMPTITTFTSCSWIGSLPFKRIPGPLIDTAIDPAILWDEDDE